MSLMIGPLLLLMVANSPNALQPAPAYTLPPQAFGACASGQCPAPGYYRQPGFFGVPVSR